jgi:sec-independent protein translocase protein TatA
MGRLGPTEILLIIGVALLLFGGSRIADIGKGLGEGIKNFKKGITEPKQSAESDGEDAGKDKKALKKDAADKGEDA